MRFAVLAILFPALTVAQGVQPQTINTSRISTRSPARYVSIHLPYVSANANGIPSGMRAIYPGPGSGKLVNVIIHQTGEGTGGTSYTIDLKTVAGTSLFSTLPVQTQASGANQYTDTRGAIALPSGWTRGVLKTDTTTTVGEGERLNLWTVETGTYSVHPIIMATLVFEPLQ